MYETSIYHSSKSKSMIIYDKEVERNQKKVRIESHEKDILRYEVKLLNSHLYYQMRQNNIKRELKNYWNFSLFKEYFTKEFKPILFYGDYYKLYDITKILNKTKLPKKHIEGIKAFLITISRYGVSKAKSDYTYYMFNKYINILEELGVNPIIIPKNETSLSNNKFVKNPLSKIFG